MKFSLNDGIASKPLDNQKKFSTFFSEIKY
jgi:hypothetical protein